MSGAGGWVRRPAVIAGLGTALAVFAPHRPTLTALLVLAVGLLGNLVLNLAT